MKLMKSAARNNRRNETPSSEKLQELRVITTRSVEQRVEEKLDDVIELLASERHGPSRTVPTKVELSIVLPCLNQASTIGEAILRIQFALERLGKHGEILVADQGSIDDSAELAEDLGARVIHIDQPSGLGLLSGAGGREILATAQGQVIVLGEWDDASISRWF